ncbi:hypothetical protein D1007_19140 [Hordeum vulgare]|nr:hypothetical protein D1007_19140 [Hordeum vulgare]
MLAGVKISSKGGFSMQRMKRPGIEVVPVAKVAERPVGHTLGITRDDKDVTKATLDKFTTKFKDQLAPENRYTIMLEDIIAYRNELVVVEAEARDWDAQVPQQKYFPRSYSFYQW